MKTKQIHIYLIFALFIATINMTYASSEKNERAEGATSHTQHPPHDHQEPDHIKKLDEAMKRKRKDEE